MNTIRELKQQEKYKSMLKRKNKEKKIYKDKNASLQLEKQRLYIALRNKDKEIERLNNKIQDLQADYGNIAQVERDFLKEENKRLNNIIKEVREYITSYESIETIQQFDHNKNNEDLDYSTIDEMTRRYMMVHDKILKILDKAGNSNERKM